MAHTVTGGKIRPKAWIQRQEQGQAAGRMRPGGPLPQQNKAAKQQVPHVGLL